MCVVHIRFDFTLEFYKTMFTAHYLVVCFTDAYVTTTTLSSLSMWHVFFILYMVHLHLCERIYHMCTVHVK